MSDNFEYIHTAENDPKWNMPYTPAIKVHSGKTVYVSGVTAAPVYHSHPHIAEEFDHIPLDPSEQAEITLNQIREVLQAAGGDLHHIVQMIRFIKDIEVNQDAINMTMKRMMGGHLPTNTTIEMVRQATDPRIVLEVTVVAV
ncbi:MAG: RidA family protein, partial [Chloroflexi bacterium]